MPSALLPDLIKPVLAHHAAGRTELGRHHVRQVIGKLGHVALAEDHRARRAQPAHETRVVARAQGRQREGTGRAGHAVAGADVVLQQHRQAVQRAAHAACRAFGVELRGDGERLRVQFTHGVQRRPRVVQRRDAVEEMLREAGRREPAIGHRPRQLGDAVRVPHGPGFSGTPANSSWLR